MPRPHDPLDAERRAILDNDIQDYLQKFGQTIELSLPPFQKQDFALPGIVFMTRMEYTPTQPGAPIS